MHANVVEFPAPLRGRTGGGSGDADAGSRLASVPDTLSVGEFLAYLRRGTTAKDAWHWITDADVVVLLPEGEFVESDLYGLYLDLSDLRSVQPLSKTQWKRQMEAQGCVRRKADYERAGKRWRPLVIRLAPQEVDRRAA